MPGSAAGDSIGITGASTSLSVAGFSDPPGAAVVATGAPSAAVLAVGGSGGGRRTDYSPGAVRASASSTCGMIW
jgi:hypothetical protein